MSKPNYWLILFFLCITEMASAQFGPQQQLHSCLCSVSKMLSADLDGDRFPDLLVHEWYTSNLMWFKNDGKGGVSRQFFVAPSQRRRFKESFFTADLDGDKDSDVLAMLNDNQLVWFKNDGKGQFGVCQCYGAQISISSIGNFEAVHNAGTLEALNEFNGGSA